MFNSIDVLSGNSQFIPTETPPLNETLQTMLDTVGQILEVDLCILRGFETPELKNQCWIWSKNPIYSTNSDLLRQTIWKTPTQIALSEVNATLSLFLPKTEASQFVISAYQQTKICSTLLMPVILNRELVGVLGLHHCQNKHNWQDKEIKFTEIVADQIILTINHHQDYQKFRYLAQREYLINTITMAIRSSLDPQTLFNAITYQLGQALNVDGCALSLWTKDDQFVHCVGLYDREEFKKKKANSASGEAFRVTLPQSIVPIADNLVLQKLLKTSKPVVVDDLESYPELAQSDLPLRSPARALLIVPLRLDREIIGSISLRQTDQTRFWSKLDIELAQAVASQAAIAVQHSRLYETTREQAEQLRESEQKVKRLNQYLTESVLKRFLPPSIVNRVAAGELVLDLSPETRVVTILFSDIVGFTPLSDHLGTRRIAILLNEYLESMTQAVFQYGGTVDKFVGDAILALFGAPESLSEQEQVKRAIAVARAMHSSLKDLNQRWQEKGWLGGENTPLVQFRCGIHQGQAVVGMFGGGQRSDYTAIGPTVNIAARLQKAADANTILVSQTVANYLAPREINQVMNLTLKGIENEVLAFSVKIIHHS